MADNTTLPGTGDVIGADDVGGVKIQRIKAGFGPDGSYVDVSPANPLPVTADAGLLVQRMEHAVMLLARILNGAAGQMPDTVGRTRVVVESFPASIATISNVTNVNSVSRLSQLGNTSPDPTHMVYAQSNAAVAALRDRITVS